MGPLMKMPHALGLASKAHARRKERGITLIETVAAVVVLGVAIPPLVNLFSEVSTQGIDDTYQRTALVYAEALMEEIVSKEFEDPNAASGSFGKEENLRRNFDDFDDFM